MRKWLMLLIIIAIGVAIMAHGTPDWGQSKVTTVFSQVDDLAELAARLFSPNTYDRRGNVVFMDDFEHGLNTHWRKNYDYTGTPVLSAAAAKNGSFSAKLVTTALEDATCGMLHYGPVPIESKVGLEVSFALQNRVGSLEFRTEIYDGTNLSTFAVKYLPESDKWQYLDSGEAWQDLVTSMDLRELDQYFHTFKLVFDYENDEYIRFMVNNHTESMADIACFTDASETTSVTRIYITVINDSENIAYALIDDIILTQNEP